MKWKCIDDSSGRNISSLSKLLLNHSQYAEGISHAEQRAVLFSIFCASEKKRREHQAGKLEGAENGKFTYYYSGGKQFYRR